MAEVTYKCPSCGAYLVFNPDKQLWTCDFCKAEFPEGDLLSKADQRAQEAERDAAKTNAAAEQGTGTQVVYHCSSCGSEIMTDETTVATHCYYCHNPVVLQGKLTADMRPNRVLPFQIGKDNALKAFLEWAKKKRFIPKGFFSQSGVEEMAGVYYPHFISTIELDSVYDGEGANTSAFDSGDYIITKTDHYAVHRRGKLTFRNVMRPALASMDRKLSDGVHPYPLENIKPFSGAYLSGFLAERRDIEAGSLRDDLTQEADGYAQNLLTSDTHYHTEHGNTHSKLEKLDSEYVLLPSWILTYQKPGGQTTYYYAMNGVTGNVCGKLPVDRKKLYLTGLGVGAALFALLCVLCYFLF